MQRFKERLTRSRWPTRGWQVAPPRRIERVGGKSTRWLRKKPSKRSERQKRGPSRLDKALDEKGGNRLLHPMAQARERFWTELGRLSRGPGLVVEGGRLSQRASRRHKE